MGFFKVATYLVLTGAITFLTYDKVMRQFPNLLHRQIQNNDEILDELIIESVPAIRLLHLKYKDKKELSEEDLIKIPLKLERVIFDILLSDVCKRKEADQEKFMVWLKDEKNETGKIFLEQVKQTEEELKSNLSPVSIDYIVKEELTKREFAQLAYRKYCDYQKYQLFNTLLAELKSNENFSNADKEAMTRNLTQAELTWREVFERMGLIIEEGEKAELEFRKAFYKLKFDRAWLNEIQKIENDHHIIMGAILEFTNKDTEELLKVNPLTLSNNSTEYRYDIDLPYLREASEEIKFLLCQRFRTLYAKEPSQLEIKHQRALDQVQQNLNQSTSKSYKLFTTAGPIGAATKSIRSILSKDSESSKRRRGQENPNNMSFTSGRERGNRGREYNPKPKADNERELDTSQILDSSINHSVNDIQFENEQQ